MDDLDLSGKWYFIMYVHLWPSRHSSLILALSANVKGLLNLLGQLFFPAMLFLVLEFGIGLHRGGMIDMVLSQCEHNPSRQHTEIL